MSRWWYSVPLISVFTGVGDGAPNARPANRVAQLASTMTGMIRFTERLLLRATAAVSPRPGRAPWQSGPEAPHGPMHGAGRTAVRIKRAAGGTDGSIAATVFCVARANRQSASLTGAGAT